VRGTVRGTVEGTQGSLATCTHTHTHTSTHCDTPFKKHTHTSIQAPQSRQLRGDWAHCRGGYCDGAYNGEDTIAAAAAGIHHHGNNNDNRGTHWHLLRLHWQREGD
jgi:hypothetical protein